MKWQDVAMTEAAMQKETHFVFTRALPNMQFIGALPFLLSLK